MGRRSHFTAGQYTSPEPSFNRFYLDAFPDRLRAHKHTDVSITCLCGELSVLDVQKLFANLVKLVKSEYQINVTNNPNSIH